MEKVSPRTWAAILQAASFVLSLALGGWGALAADKPQPNGESQLTSSEAVWLRLTGPKAVQKPLLGKRIEITGWIIPNEFESDEMTAFLLTRYPSGCVHVPLPPPGNIIHVVMADGAKRLKAIASTKKILVSGRLEAGGRVDASFEMMADSVQEVLK